MKKMLCCLTLATFLCASVAGTVQAEEISGSKNWVVEFDGKEMNSSFQSDEMAEEIFKMLPGDTMELQVSILNSGEDTMNWYLSNEIVKSLEEGSDAQGGAYTYRLSYVDAEGEENILYDSDTVGGEGESAAGEGLNQATNALEEFMYLDQLQTGESGKVNLRVTLDGETQGNGYQNTLAQLQMNFAAEMAGPDTIIEKGEDQTIEKTEKEKDTVTTIYQTTTTPKTGDTAPLLLMSALALVSGIVLLVFGVIYLKKYRQEQEGGRKS